MSPKVVLTVSSASGYCTDNAVALFNPSPHTNGKICRIHDPACLIRHNRLGGKSRPLMEDHNIQRYGKISRSQFSKFTCSPHFLLVRLALHLINFKLTFLHRPLLYQWTTAKMQDNFRLRPLGSMDKKCCIIS